MTYHCVSLNGSALIDVHIKRARICKEFWRRSTPTLELVYLERHSTLDKKIYITYKDANKLIGDYQWLVNLLFELPKDTSHLRVIK